MRVTAAISLFRSIREPVERRQRFFRFYGDSGAQEVREIPASSPEPARRSGSAKEGRSRRFRWCGRAGSGTASAALGAVVVTLGAAWSLLPSISPAATVTAADNPLLLSPEAIDPSGLRLYVLAQSPADRATPYQTFLYELARSGAPAPREPSAELLALQDKLADSVHEASLPGLIAIAVTDLQTGETIGVALDRVQLPGCIINLFVIIAALQDVDSGRYPLADVDATIRQTIWASDPTAARRLYEAVGEGDVLTGVRVVSALLGTLQMASSFIDHPPAFPEDSIGFGTDNLITARDVNKALARLYSGQVLSPELTAYLLEAMTRVKPGLNYLTAVVPAPATVSHKNGFLWDSGAWVDNDTSIVRFGPELEYAYALTLLSEGVPLLYDDVPLGQHLVLETWEYFQAAYDSSGTGPESP